MHQLLMATHILACVSLIFVVLLQAGRGAGFALFGGGGDALFASKGGSTALKKATVFLASTFAVTSLMLTLIASRPGSKSVVGADYSAPSAPADPAAPVLPPPEVPPAPEPASKGQ